MSEQAESNTNIVFIDPGSNFGIRDLPAQDEDAAAVILAPATGAGTIEAAATSISELRAVPKSGLFGAYVDHDLVGVYGLQRDGMANVIAFLAVREDHRRRGIGRAMLQDALRRSGKRPLVAETDDDGLGFYKTCGFKLVGRRVHPSGTVRYRLGWHAPGLRFKGGSSGALTHQPLSPRVEPGDTNRT
ncbi:MAG TPA: GNAT family N-acetyltransferase [Thermomicrobiales bacterium]|nr:GNAT family N-acetyltransferase [Thermomicrobiales bacterium]